MDKKCDLCERVRAYFDLHNAALPEPGAALKAGAVMQMLSPKPSEKERTCAR